MTIALCQCYILVSKIFEKLLFNSIFDFMTKQSLNSFQSGFRQNYSCANQLISIARNISHVFYSNSLVEATFDKNILQSLI